MMPRKPLPRERPAGNGVSEKPASEAAAGADR
jgi:hypothetical protein